MGATSIAVGSLRGDIRSRTSRSRFRRERPRCLPQDHLKILGEHVSEKSTTAHVFKTDLAKLSFGSLNPTDRARGFRLGSEWMGTLGLYWTDLIGLAIVLVCVNGASTGRFYTHSRGRGKRLLAEVGSFRVRLVFLCAGIAMFLLVARDLLQKIRGAGLK